MGMGPETPNYAPLWEEDTVLVIRRYPKAEVQARANQGVSCITMMPSEKVS